MRSTRSSFTTRHAHRLPATASNAAAANIDLEAEA
jgi:hypothetical protein